MGETTSGSSDYLVKLVLGIVTAVLSAAIVASFALLLSMSARLTVVETIVGETKIERRLQIEELQETDRELIQRVAGLERSGRRRGGP